MDEQRYQILKSHIMAIYCSLIAIVVVFGCILVIMEGI